MEIRRVGVVGCGFMGSGITEVVARAGYPVTCQEVNKERLDNALSSISFRLNESVRKGKLSQQDRDSILARIRGTTSMEDFRDCDLVIEAVPEDMDLKKRVLAELDGVCPAHAILASNTSCLSLIDIAMATGRPDRVLGTHFLSPVPQSRLVEIVQTLATSARTLEIAQGFIRSLGKTFITTRDAPGFVFNRLYIALTLTAIRLLESGAATPEEVDKCMTLGLGHPIGPLALADFNGIDVLLSVASSMYEELKDPAYAPPVLMKRMVAAGWLGRKGGRGFYEYDRRQTEG